MIVILKFGTIQILLIYHLCNYLCGQNLKFICIVNSNRMSDEKTIVIHQGWGGLGDNLQFSTLPELYSGLGYKVYISSKNAYRNPEIYDLVWKLNPYVEGLSDVEPNAGGCKGYFQQPIDFISEVELNHGLKGYRKYPVVYYKPTLIPELSNTLLYDATSIYANPEDTQINSSFQTIFTKYSDLPIKKLQFEKINNKETSYFSHDTYTIKSIYDLCDAIYSCKVFLCLFSGSSVLASAIKQDAISPDIYCFHHSNFTNNPIYKFNNIKYSEFV